MCGIAGAYGSDALRLSLLMTLGQLNRGTQGIGLAWIEHGRLRMLKEPVHPVMFTRRHYHKLSARVRVAIAHNRQPSCGKVCYNNTHPFMSCNRSFALVHNGSCVFDNNIVSRIRREHRVMGETDSEIICHMLEELYDEQGDMVAAIEALFNTSFSGAILVLTNDGRIYGARKYWAPLHYAKVGNHVLLASEPGAIMGVLDGIANVVALRSRQIIEVYSGRVRVHGEGEPEPHVGYYRALSRRASLPYYPWAYDWDYDPVDGFDP